MLERNEIPRSNRSRYVPLTSPSMRAALALVLVLVLAGPAAAGSRVDRGHGDRVHASHHSSLHGHREVRSCKRGHRAHA